MGNQRFRGTSNPGCIVDRSATDEQVLEAFDRVYAEHRWPNEDNIGLRICQSRVIELRIYWADIRGITLLCSAGARRFNQGQTVKEVFTQADVEHEPEEPAKAKKKRKPGPLTETQRAVKEYAACMGRLGIS